MKKSLILMAVLCLILTTNCKKKKDTKLEYLGENPIEIALRDNLALNVNSEYPVTVTSLNEKYVTTTGGLRCGQIVGL